MRLRTVGIGIAVIAACLAGLALSAFVLIEIGERKIVQAAHARFSGTESEALIQLVNCNDCSLRQRDRAVWALGQKRESKALGLLHAHYTGQQCHHDRELCQYELKKAIKRIEGRLYGDSLFDRL